MMDPDFPRSVHLVNLYADNLVDLPLSVATLWPQGGMLMYARMGASRFPDVIFYMVFYYLSLAGNQLSEIPVKLFYAPYLAMLDLAGNPLTSLPEVPQSMINEYGPPGATMQSLDVSCTGLQQLPSWFGTRPIRLVALNTPFCVKLKAGDPTIPTSELIKQLVVC
ncbi:hypothetical protein Poli38472_005991 [Pythium oligandrum]|uniref:Uncharacterized protein n=1 Tax=Pythium oligandrum TaxID=41045 RepID=A0A8K1CT99_PYTOL|nr:hypothetical protein Poli38472_005991 [Pythium oligandrum]|eukprot:TMW68523.1 hypothetical protein Poli38472_005991 [Pythium oligandrum]